MKVLNITDGSILGLAWKMVQEDHDVYLGINDPRFNLTGNGIYSKRSSWRTLLDKADFVIADGRGMGKFEDLFRSKGRPVLGINYLADILNDRKQQEFIDQCGISFCSDFEQIVLVHGFFNGRGWVSPFFLSFSENHLFPGNLGPLVDCMGTVVIPLKGSPKIIEMSLEKATDAFKKIGLRGFVTAAIGYNDEGEGISAVHCGMSYDCMEAICEGLKEPLTDVLFEIASGVKKEIDFTEDYLIAVRMTLPPWPYPLGFVPSEGPIIEGLNEANLPHVYLCDIYRDNGNWRVGMGSGVVLKATARGRTIREARRRVYRTLGNISVPAKQYRLDIGEGIDERIRELKVRGLI